MSKPYLNDFRERVAAAIRWVGGRRPTIRGAPRLDGSKPTKISSEIFQLHGAFGGTHVEFAFANRNNLDFYAEMVRNAGLAAYEAPTPAIISRLVKTRGGAVIDIGAHTGLLTLLAAASNPETIVHAFEPLPHIRATLEANLKLNPRLEPRIRVYDIALSDCDATLVFYETINDMGFLSSSSSLEIDHAKTIDYGLYQEREVTARKLDHWAAKSLGPEFLNVIKIDVERHEHAVLQGGLDMIRARQPMIVIEILPQAPTGPHNALLADGYLDFAITQNGLLQRLHVDYFHGAANHLLCPADRTSEVFGLCRDLNLSLDVSCP